MVSAYKRRSHRPALSLGGFGECREEVESQDGTDVFEVVFLGAVEEVVVVRLQVHRKRDLFVVLGRLRRLALLGRLPHFA